MLVVIGVLAIAALICRRAVYRINRPVRKRSRLVHPHEDDVPRAQQVHPSIDTCEALLADETKSHTWSA